MLLPIVAAAAARMRGSMVLLTLVLCVAVDGTADQRTRGRPSRPGRRKYEGMERSMSVPVPTLSRHGADSLVFLSGIRKGEPRAVPRVGPTTFLLNGPFTHDVIEKLLLLRKSREMHDRKATLAGFAVGEECDAHGGLVSLLDGTHVREFSRRQSTDLSILESLAIPQLETPADIFVINGLSPSILLSADITKKLQRRMEDKNGGGVIIIGDSQGCISCIASGDVVLVDTRCASAGELQHIARALFIDVAHALASKGKFVGHRVTRSSSATRSAMESSAGQVRPGRGHRMAQDDEYLRALVKDPLIIPFMLGNPKREVTGRGSRVEGLEDEGWALKARKRDERRLQERIECKSRILAQGVGTGEFHGREDDGTNRESDWSNQSDIQRVDFAGACDRSTESSIDYAEAS